MSSQDLKFDQKCTFIINVPSVRSHGTLAMIMVNLAKSCFTMASLQRSWQDHGKIMARSWQDLGKATKELAIDLGEDAMVSNTGQTH